MECSNDKDMKIFDRKYKKRIEKKIIELEEQICAIEKVKRQTNEIRNTTTYCRLVLDQNLLREKSKLLKELL